MDLQPYTIVESDCNEIFQQLQKYFMNYLQNSISSNYYRIVKQNPKGLFWKLFNHFFRNKILKLIALESFNVTLTVGNLLLLNLATKSLTSLDKDNISIPILQICGIVTLFLLKTISQAKTESCLNQINIRLRLTAEYLIYNKALKIQCISGDSHIPNINTLLTADLDQIVEISFTLQYLWEQILLVVGCLLFLYHIDNSAATVVFLTIIASTICFQLMTVVIIASQKKLFEFKDQRVELTTDVIDGMKQIKYLSWEETFSNKIMKYRKKEYFMLILLKSFDGLTIYFYVFI